MTSGCTWVWAPKIFKRQPNLILSNIGSNYSNTFGSLLFVSAESIKGGMKSAQESKWRTGQTFIKDYKSHQSVKPTDQQPNLCLETYTNWEGGLQIKCS